MRLNKAHLARAEAVLVKAERVLAENKMRQSAGVLWRQDVIAFRYALEALKKAVSGEGQ